MKTRFLLVALTLAIALPALGEDTPGGRHRVATQVGGGSASDVLNMRAAPGAPAGEAKPSQAAPKFEITCVDDAGNRFDSHEAGYRECLGRKGKH